uniref:Uncharacterized protein n=1 Tax=Auxenochlorella protothecoides TaxID=3075 RepID=A0A1D1ZQ84_AUXPR
MRSLLPPLQHWDRLEPGSHAHRSSQNVVPAVELPCHRGPAAHIVYCLIDSELRSQDVYVRDQLRHFASPSYNKAHPVMEQDLHLVITRQTDDSFASLCA